MNALSAAVQESLRDAIRAAMNDSDVDAVVIIGAGHTFVAGADIKQLERMAHDGAVRSILPQVLVEIEAAPKPFVAAIHGNAFGGGLEVALAAHYRVATAGRHVSGNPKSSSGIIPGAGGTQRLPRLAGVEAALEMCVFGEPDPRRRCEASRYHRSHRRTASCSQTRFNSRREASRRQPAANARSSPIDSERASPTRSLFAAYRERARKTRRNLRRPLAAIDAIEAATELPFEEGCRRERQLFERLLVSSQAKALIHVFLAERAASEGPESRQERCRHPDSIRRGRWRRNDGTRHRDVFRERRHPGSFERLQRLNALRAAVTCDSGDLPELGSEGTESRKTTCDSGSSRIQPQLDYAGFDAADIVIEAAFENIDVKTRQCSPNWTPVRRPAPFWRPTRRT